MTIPDLTCLSGVIGLANCACPCQEAVAPEGWNTASSGLYLADLLPLNMADAGTSCEEVGNAWNVLNTARRMGLGVFMNDYRSRLGKRTQRTRETFKGRIGEQSARDTVALTKTYAGVRIPTANIRGGYFNLTKLGGVFSAAGSVSVQIYDRFNNAVGAPIVITTVADTLAETTLTTPRTLPLWTEQGQRAEYWLVYEVNPDNLPKAIRIYCPCGGTALPVFNTAKPYWQQTKHRYEWMEWIGVAPWEGDTLTDFDLDAESSLVSSSGYTNGLTMQIELTCDPASVLCLGGLDYSDKATLAASYAAWYSCAIQGAEYLLRNTEAFRSAAVTAEVLAGFLPVWRERFDENLNYAVYDANLKGADCVACKPGVSFSIQGKQP